LTKVNDAPPFGRKISLQDSGNLFRARVRANMYRFSTTIIVVLTANIVLGNTVMAQSQAIPTPIVEEVMVKTSLLTLNDANLTGDYDVMHARMAKPYREKFGADTLKQAFKAFAGKHIDVIASFRRGAVGGLHQPLARQADSIPY
jgi:hypothetical protein